MNTIEAETVKEPVRALAKRDNGEVVQHQGNPLDMAPEMFKAGLARRGENRNALMDWIRSALVSGVDFGKIHTVKKSECSKGKFCDNPRHFSKDSLFKPGSEKICGMLGVTPTFPTLKDYEDACLRGVEIRSIILRCEIVNAAGQVIAVGVGGRDVTKDYGDINKALKMAEKSAQIDATLRMGGLSEVFTQDIEDMNLSEPAAPRNSNTRGLNTLGQSADGAGAHGASRTTEGSGEKSRSPGEVNTPARTVPPSGVAATIAQRDKMLEELLRVETQDAIKDYAVKAGILLPTETLLDWPLRFVPVTKGQMGLLLAAVRDFFDGEDALKPFVNPEPGEPPKEDKPKVNGVGVEVPRDAGVGTWRDFPVPFGKNAGKKLGELNRNSLAAYARMMDEECATDTYEDKTTGQTKTKSAQAMAKNRRFKEQLDAWRAEVGAKEEAA